MVSVVSIATALVLDECKAASMVSVQDRRRFGRRCTHSLLEAVRGAGISQRTRRPYLRVLSIHVFGRRAAGSQRSWAREGLERLSAGSGIRSVVEQGQEGGISAAVEHHDGVMAWVWPRGQVGVRGRAVGRWRLIGDVPFEFESEVARASAVAEASHVESGAAAARHDVGLQGGLLMRSGGRWTESRSMEVVERQSAIESRQAEGTEARLIVHVTRDVTPTEVEAA